MSSVAALTSDATALGKLHQSDGVTQAQVIVTDTAANISAALDTLEVDGQVQKTIVSDSASNQVFSTVAQLTADVDALGKLYQAGRARPRPR